MTVFTSCGGGSFGKIKMTTDSNSNLAFILTGSGAVTVDWGDGSEKVMQTLNEGRVRFEHTYYPNVGIHTITIKGDNITEFWGGDIMSLDVSRCTELTKLEIINGQLTNLDISKNSMLKHLWFSNVALTNLDVSKNTALEVLVSESQLASLDVSKNIALKVLVCEGQITSLDVSKNTKLEILICNGQLTNLDISKNTALKLLGFGNQLTVANLHDLFRALHSNMGEKYIRIDSNPGAFDCDRSIAERKGWTFQ